MVNNIKMVVQPHLAIGKLIQNAHICRSSFFSQLPFFQNFKIASLLKKAMKTRF